jgi:CRP-like cAMP-binding protein
MSVRADAESLRALPVFRQCDPVHLQVLAFSAEKHTFLRGEYLVEAGAPARLAYFILSGSADLRLAEKDREQTIGQAEPGSFIGEVAMIGGTRYSLSAVARDGVTAAAISRDLFNKVVQEYPEFGRAVHAVLAERLEQSVRELEGVRGIISRARSFSSL